MINFRKQICKIAVYTDKRLKKQKQKQKTNSAAEVL